MNTKKVERRVKKNFMEIWKNQQSNELLLTSGEIHTK